MPHDLWSSRAHAQSEATPLGTAQLTLPDNNRQLRRVFAVSSLLVAAYVASLFFRQVGSSVSPVDGWGVDVFELAMCALCLGRYFDRGWRASEPSLRIFPLVLGAAGLSWALGDLVLSMESLGNRTPSTPSVADGFYILFFPLCYLSLMLLIRRGNRASLAATSLDGLIAGLGVATLAAAFVFEPVIRVTGATSLTASFNLAYPIGDLLLLALALGGIAILPKEYRPFLVIISVAMTVNAAGDMFNLLQPDSTIGSVSNSSAWPISLLALAIAAWVFRSDVHVRLPLAEKVGTERKAGFVAPTAGALASVCVLIAAALGEAGRPAVAFATATLVVAGFRLALTVREARAMNSARFRSLIDNAWDIIVVAEADLNVAFITPSAQRVLGYHPAELEGAGLTRLLHPDDVEVLTGALGGLREDDADRAVFEVRMRHRDGAWRTLAWTASSLLTDPSVAGYVLNGGDVTEVRQAAEDLVAARDGALMASRAKSEFLSTMSHEIRTPMNGVIGLTELLQGTPLTSEQTELVTGIEVSAGNLLSIINDILDFSKVEAGKLELEEAEFDLRSVADNVGRILAATAYGKGLELLIDVDPDIPAQVTGDAVRIQQVLLNLGSNAVKFTLEGEVVIRISVLATNLERVAVRFEVVDMGIGIAEVDQERLFRAFAQADSSTTRKFGGTGLGLAICRQLVDLMGGHLGLHSAPGEGSTFWFELSLQRAAGAPVLRADEARTLEGKRCLVVDDNATNRRILGHHLRSWGVAFAEAESGPDALAVVQAAADRQERFDLAVIDLNMPGMDGLELARLLKGSPAATGLALFLLSSSGELLGPAESHLNGFSGSLMKPVRSSELFDCLISGVNKEAGATVEDDPLPAPTEPAEWKGLILLVEDNRINQLVGTKVLDRLGYQVDVANHGGEAIAAMRDSTYDAVLMDCQMPEMDGYEATARIREMEGADRRTPIIAMTAAAMDGDRDACLAAGMDDYMTKPVQMDIVSEVLARWVTRSEPSRMDDAATGPAGTCRPDPLDPAQIQFLSSLDEGGGSFLGAIVDEFVSMTSTACEAFARLVVDEDGPSLERTAHALKGASANVGARDLATICGALESLGHSAGFEEAQHVVAQFTAELERVRCALTSLTASV